MVVVVRLMSRIRRLMSRIAGADESAQPEPYFLVVELAPLAFLRFWRGRVAYAGTFNAHFNYLH